MTLPNPIQDRRKGERRTAEMMHQLAVETRDAAAKCHLEAEEFVKRHTEQFNASSEEINKAVGKITRALFELELARIATTETRDE